MYIVSKQPKKYLHLIDDNFFLKIVQTLKYWQKIAPKTKNTIEIFWFFFWIFRFFFPFKCWWIFAKLKGVSNFIYVHS